MKKPVISLKLLRQVNAFKLYDDARFEEIRIIELGDPGSTALDVVFETTLLEKVDLSAATLTGLKLVDTKILSSNLANTKSENANILRTEFIGCRLTGLQLPDVILRDTLIQRCKFDLSLFRFGSLKDVTFDECVITGSDFLGTTLERVVFRNCDLTDSEFSQTKIKEMDLRGSKVQNIHLQKDAIIGKVKVDTGQALYLSSLFGLVIED